VNGGELYFHLQQSKTFTLAQARFYMAQVVMTLELGAILGHFKVFFDMNAAILGNFDTFFELFWDILRYYFWSMFNFLPK
jgi:hypothetical protein